MSRTMEKSISRFCYISRSTQQLYCMDFNLGEPEKDMNERGKNDDFVVVFVSYSVMHY